MLQEFDGLFFRHFTLRLEVAVEIVIAQLCDNVHIIGGLEDIMQFDDVLMTDLLHDFDFTMKIFEIE